MKKSIAMKWVKALRSGKYKQGTHTLYNEETNSYCCLGVLCAVTKSREWKGYTTLPEHIQKKVGISTSFGRFSSSWVGQSLVRYNDTEKLNFDKIAKLIEKKYKQL